MPRDKSSETPERSDPRARSAEQQRHFLSLLIGAERRAQGLRI
jgi:hypothetical protein